MASSTGLAQVPAPGELNVDHVAHFVPHMAAASGELERLGFTVTPFSVQSHRAEPGRPLEPAGAGNSCVMFARGYVEFLTPIGDTPIAAQLRTAIERYVGVHLIAFGTAAPAQDYARLTEGGFRPLEPLALQRAIETSTGAETARFAVVRVPPGTMPEGRVQYCQHLTPQWLWQDRWIQHPNRTVALKGVIVCVTDPQEAGQRYARFSGLSPRTHGAGTCIATDRGYLLFADAPSVVRELGVEPPSLPWVAGYVLESQDLRATTAYLGKSDVRSRTLGSQRLLIELPPALGGIAIFETANSGMLDFH